MARLYALITWSGVAAFVFLTATFILGVTGWNFRLHGVVAMIAYSFAVIHVLLVGYKYLKVWAAKRRAARHA